MPVISQVTALDRLIEEMRQYRRRQQLDREWYQLAVILDRLAVLVFTMFIIIYDTGVMHK